MPLIKVDCIFEALNYNVQRVENGVVYTSPALTTNQQEVANRLVLLHLHEPNSTEAVEFRSWCQTNYPGIYAVLLTAWNTCQAWDTNEASWKQVLRENDVPENIAEWLTHMDTELP